MRKFKITCFSLYSSLLYTSNASLLLHSFTEIGSEALEKIKNLKTIIVMKFYESESVRHLRSSGTRGKSFVYTVRVRGLLREFKIIKKQSKIVGILILKYY